MYWIGVIEHLRREYRLTAEGDRRQAEAGALDRGGLAHPAWLGLSDDFGSKGAAPALSASASWRVDHVDIEKLARFERVGHRITGDRRHAGIGASYDCFHVAIDDATQLAYVEVLPDGTLRSITAFLVRALRWLRARDPS